MTVRSNILAYSHARRHEFVVLDAMPVVRDGDDPRALE